MCRDGLACRQMGEELVARRHSSSANVGQRVSLLVQRWQALLGASAERGKGLEEARDILRFHEELDVIQAWMREKVGTTLVVDTIQAWMREKGALVVDTVQGLDEGKGGSSCRHYTGLDEGKGGL